MRGCGVLQIGVEGTITRTTATTIRRTYVATTRNINGVNA
jgi:hypothetical protein